MILPVVFVTIFLLLYMVFRSVTEALVLIFPTLYAMTGGLLLQWYLGYNFSVAVWVGYIALFGIAVETGVVMVVYLHEGLDQRLAVGLAVQRADLEKAAIEKRGPAPAPQTDEARKGHVPRCRNTNGTRAVKPHRGR
jgi:copper/silver efflux system protein